jgi:hypothetical protein
VETYYRKEASRNEDKQWNFLNSESNQNGKSLQKDRSKSSMIGSVIGKARREKWKKVGRSFSIKWSLEDVI